MDKLTAVITIFSSAWIATSIWMLSALLIISRRPTSNAVYLKIGILLITGLLFIIINPIPAVNAQLESGLTHVMEDVKDPANIIPGKAVVLIYSNAKWSGNIMDSSLDSSTIDGIGFHREVIDCSGTLPLYSLAIQKQVQYGYILVGVVKGGILLDFGDTTADYGIVSLSGQC